MERIKRFIRKYGGEKAQKILFSLMVMSNERNNRILFSGKRANPNEVNINYWDGADNLGDIISPVIVEYVAGLKGIDLRKKVGKTKHLYAVGSVVTAGCQDCTVWGSGILNSKILYRLKGRKFDVRSVRGPITRVILIEHGHSVPEVYGDPAILMPLIYNPDVEKKYAVSVITHMNEKTKIPEGVNTISILTRDYRDFIEKIKASELIVSSSLHGIIFAEAYGVPAILLKPNSDMLKYYDYYYGTGRNTFPIADSVEQAMKIEKPNFVDFTEMRKNLLNAFPTDLWDM